MNNSIYNQKSIFYSIYIHFIMLLYNPNLRYNPLIDRRCTRTSFRHKYKKSIHLAMTFRLPFSSLTVFFVAV